MLKDGHPNQVAGSSALFTLSFRDSPGAEPALAYGVMGGHMQAQGHVQMLIRVFGFGQNPQPHLMPHDGISQNVAILQENGIHPEVVAALEAKATLKLDQPEHLFGGAQLILQLDQGYCAASITKKGHAAGLTTDQHEGRKHATRRQAEWISDGYFE